MDIARYRRVDSIFLTALDTPEHERQTYLNQACAGEEELKREVVALLHACELSTDFLEYPAFMLVDDATDNTLTLERQHFSKGAMVGYHRIVQLLGEGGMGEVYRAEDTRLNRPVALKVLNKDLAADPRARARFLREARLTSKLEHPNICTVYETGEVDGVCFIAMRFISGETLRERLQRKGALGAKQVCMIGLEVARALQAAHAHGMLHRDVTSGNVMLGPEDQVTVLDFGIAGTVEPSDSFPIQTESGLIRGTPAYMSPEQARREPIDVRSDLFSLGTLLYEMATGRLPFAGVSRAEMLSNLVNQAHVPAHLVNPAVPRAMSALLDRALAKSPNERYRSVEEFMDALGSVANSLEPLDQSKRGSWQKARITGLGLLVALLTVGIAAFWKELSHEPIAESRIHSVAVLPFVSLTRGDEPASLAHGMTETLITRLAKVPDLAVRPMMATREYPKSNQNPLHFGREQGVDAVLDGGVQRDGTAIRVNVRLTRVVDGMTVWSATFDDVGRDLFELQDVLAEGVAAAVSPSMAPDLQTSSWRAETNDPEAYRLYALGRYHADLGAKSSVGTAVEYYERALSRDPEYARAWAALADARLALTRTGQLDQDDGFGGARQAALRALALNDALVAPKLVLALIAEGRDWDWAAAERFYQEAVDQDPNDIQARRYYARFLAAMGRYEAGVQQAKRGLALAPASLNGISTYGFALFMAGRHADAIDQARIALEMNPEFGRAYFVLGMAEDAKGNYLAAIDAFEAANRLTGVYLGALGMAYAHSGQTDIAETILKRLQHGGPRVPAIEFVVLYAALGRIDDAFAALERMVDSRAWNVHILKAAPQLDPLRSDPRYSYLLERTGLGARSEPLEQPSDFLASG